MKKVLILYTSVGLGHKSMAENIGKQLSEAGFEVRLEDILKVEAGKLISVSQKIHEFILNIIPWFWSFLYKSKIFTKLTLFLRVKIAAGHSQNVRLLLEGYEPYAVIATQTTASAAVAHLKQKGEYAGFFGIAFSDFHLHRYWLYDAADFYLANTEEQKKEMTALGISPDKVFVCGMSMQKPEKIDSQKIREKFAVSPEKKVCLIASGSLGLGIKEELILSLSKEPGVKVIVVCGKNQKIYNRLRAKFAYNNVSVLGYYSPMAELYAIADIFVTKPGGLSVSEALLWNLPILISHMLPGQEELNYEFLQENGLVMPEPINLQEEILEEVETQSFRNALKNNPKVFELLNGKISANMAVSRVLHMI